MILIAIEVVIFICLVLFLLTQILIPGLTNRPFFPLFRRKKLEEKLVNAEEKLDEAIINNKIKEKQEQAEKVNKKG